MSWRHTRSFHTAGAAAAGRTITVVRHMDKNRPKPETHELAERRVRALELRKMGWTYQSIGKALNVSTTQARRDVRRVLDKRIKHDQGNVAEQRQLELERVEMVLTSLAKKVREGDTAAIDRWLKASDIRRRLLGLDADKDGSTAPVIKFLDLSIEHS